jgi:bacterioferritin-associated ferredoxin
MASRALGHPLSCEVVAQRRHKQAEQIPRMTGVGGSKWAAECGRCGRRSAGMLATSPEHAWRTLAAIGWRIYKPKDAQPYAECRTCASGAPRVANAVRRAKTRKRAS